MIRISKATFFLLAFIFTLGIARAEAAYQLKFGTLAPAGTPWADLLEEFKEKVESQTKGEVKVRVFLNGILGDERAMLQKMKFGQLSGGGFSTGGISTVVPELQVLELPFLFRSSEEADYVLDHVAKEELETVLEKRGLKLIMWAENGWLDFGNQSKPIHSPADMTSTKWFAQESDVMLAFFKELDVTAVPLAVPEVLSALQTGIVGGYHQTPVFATGAQWYTQTKYWTISHHIYQPAAVVIDKRFWDKTPENLRNIVMSIAQELQPRVRTAVRSLDEGLLKGFREAGVKIDELKPAEREAFEKATAGVAERLIKQGVFPQSLLDKIRKGLADYRAGKVAK